MKNYLRKAQIAENLGIGETTLERWIEEGRLNIGKPFRPTKRCTLFDAELVQAGIDAMQSQPADQFSQVL